MDFCGHKRGILSSKWALVDAYGWGMPVERFEPSTPHGDLFLRQARIPFRHTGLWSAFAGFEMFKFLERQARTCSKQVHVRMELYQRRDRLATTSKECDCSTSGKTGKIGRREQIEEAKLCDYGLSYPK